MILHFNNMCDEIHDRLIALSIPLAYNDDSTIMLREHLDSLEPSLRNLLLTQYSHSEAIVLTAKENEYVRHAVNDKISKLAMKYGAEAPTHVQEHMDILVSARNKLEGAR